MTALPHSHIYGPSMFRMRVSPYGQAETTNLGRIQLDPEGEADFACGDLAEQANP
ncbi:hypothetical protein GCM10022419_122100 [Nonomuraea rosea]|uniref:Uncharacterized protein n=1 Tax=Nonomuraea rosea TaxID=638574 RepID=A0ABP6ZS01_9ACTN